MRISFGGSVKIEELAELFEAALAGLKNSGIDGFSHPNLYLTPTQGGNRITLVDEDGNEIEQIAMIGHERKIFRAKTDKVKLTRK